MLPGSHSNWVCDSSQEHFRFQSTFRWHRQTCVGTRSTVVFRIECRLQVKATNTQWLFETFRGLCDAFTTPSRRLQRVTICFFDGFAPGSGITTPGPSGAAWNSFKWVCDVSQECLCFQSAFRWHRRTCVGTGSTVVFRREGRLQVKAPKT